MANEKQMDSELIEELQQRLEALNNDCLLYTSPSPRD